MGWAIIPTAIGWRAIPGTSRALEERQPWFNDRGA